MHRQMKGFTLIELLVVIAIIGILSSIVFPSVSGSRKKGSDVALQGTLNQLYQQMELYNIGHNDYGSTLFSQPCPLSGDPSVFATDSKIKSFVQELNTYDNNTTLCAAGNPSATGNATSWAVAAQLSTSQYWCTDSNGNQRTAYAMPWYIQLLAQVTPVAYALIGAGPNLGGGNGQTAVCP